MTGKEIKQAREALGWSQSQLAAEIGVGVRTVGNWERGETIPKNRMGKLEQLLRPVLVAGEVDPVRAYSDSYLLGELLRRAGEREQGQRG